MSFSTLCRCCLTVLSQRDIECFSPSTMDKYKFCIQLHACNEENLPQNFCYTCSSKIQSTYTFIKVAQACNQKLQNLISRDKEIKIDFDLNHEKMLLNGSLKDLLASETSMVIKYRKPREKSSSILRHESVENDFSNDIKNEDNLDLLTHKNVKKNNTLKREIQKGQLSLDTRHGKGAQNHGIKISKSNSNSSDEEEMQCNDSLEEIELSNIHINKSQSDNLFSNLEPIININNQNIKMESCLPIKTDEDFEETISKCEISKPLETENNNTSNHRKRSNNFVVFTCPVCSKVCKQYPSFERHVKTHGSPEHEALTPTQSDIIEQFRAKPHACNKCDKRFRFRVLLNRHNESAHSDKRPFSCDSCEKSFTRKENLRRHLFTHTSKESREKPFECDQCGKRFAEKRGLINHVFFHSGLRPYNCDHCQKTFQTRQILRKHLNIHEAGYPLMCDVCGKGFRDKYKLAEHMPRHTGEKSFACGYCSYRTAYRSVLRRHEKIIHKEKHVAKSKLVRSSSTVH